MNNGPERLRPADNPETNRLSSVFSLARRLRSFPADAINFYKRVPFPEKASMCFLGLGVVDLSQVVTNRLILNPDPLNVLNASVEVISDLGMVYAASNLRRSPLKWLAMAEGFMGGAGSALIKTGNLTGNPDLFLLALILAGASVGLGMMHLAYGSEPYSKPVLNKSTERILRFDPGWYGPDFGYVDRDFDWVDPWGRLVDAVRKERGKPK